MRTAGQCRVLSWPPMRLANFAPSSVPSRKNLLDCYIYGGLSYNRQENHWNLAQQISIRNIHVALYFSCQFVRSVNSYLIIFDPEGSLLLCNRIPKGNMKTELNQTQAMYPPQGPEAIVCVTTANRSKSTSWAVKLLQARSISNLSTFQDSRDNWRAHLGYTIVTNTCSDDGLRFFTRGYRTRLWGRSIDWFIRPCHR